MNGKDAIRRMNVALLLTLGALWAGLLVVGGSVLMTLPDGGATDAGLGRVAIFGGLTAMAAGQFVFLVVVADRLCPLASRTVVAGAELVFGGAFFLGVLGTLAALAAGATP